MITGYGVISELTVDSRGETNYGLLSRFLKQLEYKDNSNEVERCSLNKGIICATNATEEGG